MLATQEFWLTVEGDLLGDPERNPGPNRVTLLVLPAVIIRKRTAAEETLGVRRFAVCKGAAGGRFGALRLACLTGHVAGMLWGVWWWW